MHDSTHAALYAAMKMIEKRIEGEKMTPGANVDLTGKSVTVNFSKGTKVTRAIGKNGDGTNPQKNTQSLYGYAVWCMLLKRLQKFNQDGAIWNVVREVWTEVAQGNVIDMANGLADVDPELAQFVEELKAMDGPMKNQDTTRRLTKPGEPEFVIKEAA